MIFKGEHGGNHDCKRPDPKYKMNLYQRNNYYFKEPIMIRSISFPWAWTQSSRSTPTSPMHNLSFTPHFSWSCSVEILSGKSPGEYDSWKLLGSHGFREGIGSTHRGILETYTTSFKSKYHQLESRARLRKQRIQFTKGIMYPREGSQGYWIWRTLSDKIH